MPDRALVWLLRGLWVATAFTVWPAISAGLHAQPPAVRTTAAAGSWAVWAAVLVATLVPMPLTLTVLRTSVPGVLAAVAAAAATGHASTAAVALGVCWSAVVTAVVFLPTTAVLCINGPAYPNERRFPLAPPAALLVGPVELAWAALVALPTGGALLLAAKRWLLGGMLLGAGAVAATVVARALHGLSRRWLVFVPAGVVVHDAMALTDPVLFPREQVERLVPAPRIPASRGDGVLDLTLGAPRAPLELVLREEARLSVVRGRRHTEEVASRLLVAPSTPGRVLSYAAGHRLRVGPLDQRAVPPPSTSSPS